MKWIALAVALAGCQRKDAGAAEQPPPPPAGVHADYAADIGTLCDVIHLSKADEQPRGERAPIIAMWLGPHIKTSAGRDFLVKIQPLTGDAKADALEAEAHKVGLSGCALAVEWRTPQ